MLTRSSVGAVSETPESVDAPKRRFVDLTPLRQSPAFARLWAGGAIAGVGAQLTVVAVGLQVYDITRSTFAVALVGGIGLLPMVIAGLWGGTIIDAFDRRTVLIVSAILGWAATGGLALIAWWDTGQPEGSVPVWPLYVLATLIAVASTIQFAARQAVIPRLLPGSLVPAASALAGVAFGFQLTIGPALAGVLVAVSGFAWTYLVDVVLFTFGFLGIVSLPSVAPDELSQRPGWRSLREGLSFLRRAPNIRTSFLVDIIAMTFGRPHVIFPAVGALVFGGGPITVGILVAAGAVGTFLAGLFSGPVGHVRLQGRAVVYAIIVYGGFVFAFGLVVAVMQTGWFPPVSEDFADANLVAIALGAVAMAGTGASDEVSAIFRNTMMLMATPDHIRGRLQGIFTVVVTGGPRIGDLYVGTLAVAVALWFPPVLGGLLIVALLLVVYRVVPSFRAYDAQSPAP